MRTRRAGLVSFGAPMGIVARQATWITLLTTMGMVMGFVNMALLFPRWLSADEFGFTRLVVSIAVVAAQVAQFGGETTIIRYFPYFRDKANGHRGLLGLALAVGTVGALLALVILGLFHDRIADWFDDQSGLYASHGLVVLPLVLAEVYFILFRGISRSVHRSIAPVFAREFLLRLLQTGLIALQMVRPMPFTTFLLLYVLTFVLTTFVLFFDLWRADELVLGFGRMRVPRRMGRSMARYSLLTFGSGLASIAVGNIDQVMVGAMLHDGLAYVAYYAVATFLASLIMLPTRALMQPTGPILADAWRKRDHARIEHIYHRTASIQLVAGGFIFLCLWSCLDPLFSFLRPEYGLAKPALIILGITNVFSLSAGLSASIVTTSRSYWFDAVSGFALLVLNVLFDYLFILAFGFIGAAWSSMASLVIVVGGRLLFLKRRYGLWPYDGMTLRALAVIGAVAALVWFLPHVGPPVVDMAWRCAVITAAFWSLVHWTGTTPEIRDQFKKLLHRISPVTAR